MPRKGVTVSEQRQRFLQDWQLNYWPVSELAERCSISRKTAYKWIDRFEDYGHSGFHEQSRRPHWCPWRAVPPLRYGTLRGARGYWVLD
jgi:transposase-like protein